MQDKATRRQFLKVAGLSGAALSVGNFGFLEKVPPVSAQEARVTPALVKLDAGIEPLVRLIEDTPQAELLEQVAQRIRQGTTYQQAVAALFLAGVRISLRGLMSASSSTRSWSSMRRIKKVWRHRKPIAGCRSSGRSMSSRNRK